MTTPSSPLHEAVSVWRASQLGTPEDFAELDRILAEFRHEATALAYIAARVQDADVPLNVAADIEQFIWEQHCLVVNRDFGIASSHGEASNPALGYFCTPEEAQTHVQRHPGAGVHVVTRVTVESPLHLEPAHVSDSAPTASG